MSSGVCVHYSIYEQEAIRTRQALTLFLHPSHHGTGAGSVMEALDLGKALLVVVNTGLMDDHQQELARAMEEQVRQRVGEKVERDFVRRRGGDVQRP